MKYLIAPYQINGIESANLKQCLDFLDTASVIGIDTETTGLDPHTCKVIMLQIGDRHTQYVIDTRFVDVSALLVELSSPKHKKLGANLRFDYKMLLSNFGIRINNLWDVQIVEKVFNTGKKRASVSLKALAEKYSSIELDKDERLEFTKIGNQPFNERQVIYGARDVEVLFDIYEKQLEIEKKEELHICVRLENKFVEVIAEMEYCGMYVDAEKWAELAQKNTEEMYKAQRALTQWLVDNNKYQYLSAPDLFNNEVSCLINWGSPAQVAKLFMEEGIEVEVLDEEKSDEYSELMGEDVEIYKYQTGKVELERFKDNELVNKFLLYKKYQKAVTTYGLDWLNKFINSVTKRVHSSFDQIKSTGRLGSYSPNVQQIPSFKSPDKLSCEAHRTCFVAPEGWSLITKDFSGCELRILADYSNEQSMIDEFVLGTGDLHSLTASKVFRKKVDSKTNKHLRQIGKTLNFAITKF